MSLLRELGEQAVLEADLSRGTDHPARDRHRHGLSKPTVSAAVSRLEQAGLVRTAGTAPGQRGRKPLAFVVSDRAGYVIGADIGGTNLRVATCDLFGEPIMRRSAPRPRTAAGLSARRSSRWSARPSIAPARITAGRSRSGSRSPAWWTAATGRVTSLAHNVAPEGGFDPLAVIRGRFDLPVLVENNVNLAAVGEKWFGLARGVSTMVFIAVGAGVGMGIVIDDELVRGAHGAAGEIAFLPLVGDPFDPRHRLHGGLEDEVAAAGILAAYALGAARRPRRRAPCTRSSSWPPAATGAAREVVEHVAARLGAAIATVCAILDPGLVVLGGGIGANPLLLRPVRGAAAALAPITARIETTMLGDRAAVQGALAVALQARPRGLLSQGTSGPTAGAWSPAARQATLGGRMASIAIRSVSKRYRDGTQAVPDFDLEIADGEFMILVGPSGCGKTTLLRMIAGLEEISAGQIAIGERVVNDLEPRQRDIAMVFQNYALYPHMTVAKNMGFALKRAGVPPARSSARSRRPPSCWASPSSCSAGRPTSRAASASAWPWAERSCATRRRSSWTSRCPTSTPSCASRCGPRCCASSAACRPPRSTSPTTRPRR